MLKKLVTVAALAIGMSATQANAYEIQYQDDYSANWANISASYGSVAGLLDVTYWDAERNTNSFRYWSGSYSGRSVAFAGNTDGGSTGVITLTPVAGQSVSLASFFLGSYVNANRATSYYIDDLATTGIDIQSGPVVVGAAGLVITPGITSSAGIKIGFGPNAYNVGINNIAFNVTPVPEPEMVSMMVLGLGLLGFAARRRKTQ
ncbi:MAG: PEP-CTERM sorting domain-containing protein [Rhodocyclaceae bacterium]|nr:PEP-CTERM sorting domain-containing protein [Rhodocyclaceae bacterium]